LKTDKSRTWTYFSSTSHL